MSQNLNNFILARTTSSVADVDTLLTVVQEATTKALNRIALLKVLVECSVSTGGYVQVNPQIGCLPMLVGNDSRPVFLYQFVEALDGLVDYDRIREEFPTLSYAQIDGAMAFIRKVAQINARGIDIDELEDAADAEDAQLIDALRTAVNDRETSRVLHND